MNRDAFLVLGAFVATFVGAAAYIGIPSTTVEPPIQEQLQDQPQDPQSVATAPAPKPAPPTPAPTPVTTTRPSEPATKPSPKASPATATAPPATKRASTEEEIAKAIVEKNASWVFLHDRKGKPIVDANGRRVLSPLGQRYAYYLAQAEKNGVRGATNQHNWTMAKLAEENKPPTFRETAKSLGYNPDSNQLGAMMTKKDRVRAVLAFARELRAWQERTNSPSRLITYHEMARYLGYNPESKQPPSVMTEEEVAFVLAVLKEAQKAWTDE